MRCAVVLLVMLFACGDNEEIVCARGCAARGYSYQAGTAFKPAICMCGNPCGKDGGQ